jgi:ABC-type nitrate/sulfonate/bicarbonate transport system permease component
MIFLTDAVAVVGILLLAAAGLSMALTTWNVRNGWIAVAIASFILIAPIGPLIVERRLHVIEREAKMAEEGSLPDALTRRISDPVIGAALAVLIALLLGIVFLMTTKPVSLLDAIVSMLIALAVGLALGAPLWLRRSAPDGVAPRKN